MRESRKTCKSCSKYRKLASGYCKAKLMAMAPPKLAPTRTIGLLILSFQNSYKCSLLFEALIVNSELDANGVESVKPLPSCISKSKCVTAPCTNPYKRVLWVAKLQEVAQKF